MNKIMTVREIAEKLNLRVFSGEAGLDREVTGGYVSDLLSDVMGFAKDGSVWVTLQTHKRRVFPSSALLSRPSS